MSNKFAGELYGWQAVKYNSPIKKVSNICYNGIAKTQKTGGRKPMESLAQKERKENSSH